MATTGASFIFQNNQTDLAGAAAVVAIPYVEAVDHQSAMALAGRGPGGSSYLANSNSATNNIILLDDMVTRTDKLPYAKNGVICVTLNGTEASTISLLATNTAVTNGTVTLAGDTAFVKWNQLIFYNLSGLDGNAGADLVITPGSANGATLPLPASNSATVALSSRHVYESITGVTISASAKNVTITGNGGNVAVVISGS